MISKKVIELDQATLSLSYYGDEEGHFFWCEQGTRVRNAVRCRETVQSYMHNGGIGDLGYILRGLDVRRLDRFLATACRRLRIKPPTVCRTDADGAVLIRLGWWNTSNVRRSVFTLLLRCGACYYCGDFDRALASYELTNKCLPALKWFLSGHTKLKCYIGPGFVDLFSGTQSDPRRLLVRPRAA
jgi:hypothetical protein